MGFVGAFRGLFGQKHDKKPYSLPLLTMIVLLLPTWQREPNLRRKFDSLFACLRSSSFTIFLTGD